MRVVYPQEMNALDRAAIEGGIPSLDLMEEAGRAVAEQARDLLSICAGKAIHVVAAKGNNGGDGFVAARYLLSWGATAKVSLLDDESELSVDAAANHHRFIDMGGEVMAADADTPASGLSGCDLAIDAIFGTGFRGAAEGKYAQAIEALNGSGVPVLAVDVPSGVEADTGAVAGPAVGAVRTVTFAWPKVGLYLYPGAEKAGEIVVADIGIPSDLLPEIVESDIHTIEEEYVAGLLPRRNPYAHKGECGRVLVVAGSVGLTGAAVLCSRAAIRAGAGVVTLGIPAALNPILEAKLTEVMTLPLPDVEGSYLDGKAAGAVLEALPDYDVLALGPGLGTAPETVKAVSELLRRSERPLVLDADGINCAAAQLDSLKGRDYPTLITPHPGELGRLLGMKAKEVQAARLDAIMKVADACGCAVILKGANTLVTDGEKGVYINPLAMAGLATAGSGDVLTGCTAALYAQGLEPLQAALCGVFIHGKAAELAAHLVGPVGMVAGDIIPHLPLALSGLLREREGGWRT